MAKPLLIQNIESRIQRDGDSMEGFLSLYGNPTENLHAATKEYVDSHTQITPLSSKTVYVSPTGSDDNDGLTDSAPKLSIKNTILEFQDKVGRLTIKLANGEYNEEIGAINVRIPDLAIQGMDAETAGGSAILNITSTILPTGNSIRFHNLTIKMSDSVTDATAITNQMGKLYMQNCKINLPEDSAKYCVSTVYGGTSFLRNCIFNSGTAAGAAIAADQAISVKVIAPTTDREAIYRDYYALNGGTIEYTEKIANSTNLPFHTETSKVTPFYPLESTEKSYIVGLNKPSNNNKNLTHNASVYTQGSVLQGAAWNDYAEYRNQKQQLIPGYCVTCDDDGVLDYTNERLSNCEGIISDTFGFAIGQTDDCKTPIAVAGRVLAYCEGDRNDYHAGDVVCATFQGLISKMTEEEICKYPYRIVGIVSEIPNYENWGAGNIAVNDRIWIRIK